MQLSSSIYIPSSALAPVLGVGEPPSIVSLPMRTSTEFTPEKRLCMGHSAADDKSDRPTFLAKNVVRILNSPKTAQIPNFTSYAENIGKIIDKFVNGDRDFVGKSERVSLNDQNGSITGLGVIERPACSKSVRVTLIDQSKVLAEGTAKRIFRATRFFVNKELDQAGVDEMAESPSNRYDEHQLVLPEGIGRLPYVYILEKNDNPLSTRRRDLYEGIVLVNDFHRAAVNGSHVGLQISAPFEKILPDMTTLRSHSEKGTVGHCEFFQLMSICNMHDILKSSEIPLSPYVDAPLLKLRFKDRFDLFIQLAHSFKALHEKNCIHCDVKFVNVLVDYIEREGEGRCIARITDFDLTIGSPIHKSQRIKFYAFWDEASTKGYQHLFSDIYGFILSFTQRFLKFEYPRKFSFGISPEFNEALKNELLVGLKEIISDDDVNTLLYFGGDESAHVVEVFKQNYSRLKDEEISDILKSIWCKAVQSAGFAAFDLKKIRTNCIFAVLEVSIKRKKISCLLPSVESLEELDWEPLVAHLCDHMRTVLSKSDYDNLYREFEPNIKFYKLVYELFVEALNSSRLIYKVIQRNQTKIDAMLDSIENQRTVVKEIYRAANVTLTWDNLIERLQKILTYAPPADS